MMVGYTIFSLDDDEASIRSISTITELHQDESLKNTTRHRIYVYNILYTLYLL